METGYGSGTFPAALRICSGDGAGRWSAPGGRAPGSTSGSTRAYDRSMRLGFPISKATTTTTITGTAIRGGKTVVTGTVLDGGGGAATSKFGYVAIKVERPDGSWQRGGRSRSMPQAPSPSTVDQCCHRGRSSRPCSRAPEAKARPGRLHHLALGGLRLDVVRPSGEAKPDDRSSGPSVEFRA
jgi:hypothetical protein